MKPTINDIEQYSCETYGVTMEQVKEKGTRKKQPLLARMVISYLALNEDVMSEQDISNRYNWDIQTIGRHFWMIEHKKGSDVELNSVITEFERAY